MILESFTKRKIELYRGTQQQEAILLVKALLESPDDFDRHLHRYAARISVHFQYS